MPSSKTFCVLACLFVLVADISVVPSAASLSKTNTVINPFAGDPAAVAAGRVLYQQTCLACHGAEATGDRGPALATGNFRHGSTDADLFHTIQTGVEGTQMPAFSVLPADSVWQIISYLRSLNARTGMQNEVVPGDAAAGDKVYWGKAGCSACHEVDGRGGIVGPDLSAAGVSTAAYLRNAILNPNSARSPGSIAVLVKTQDGKEIRGIRRAEDSYTLIMTDLNGDLHKFEKRNLLEEQVLPSSLMPVNYGQTLSQDEIQNLIAYLKSLKVRDLSKTIQAELPAGLSYERLRNAKSRTPELAHLLGKLPGTALLCSHSNRASQC